VRLIPLLAIAALLLPLSAGTPVPIEAGMLPDATVAGALTAPYPTTVALSLVWEIQGDDDLDGRVSVEFRERNGTAWLAGPTLLRVPAGSYQTFNWTNKHAGSIFGLRSATDYEVRLSLGDPDGGSETRHLNATTRSVPAPMPGGPVKLANPANFSSVAGGAQPGDIVQMENGTYAGFTHSRNGAAGRPIVLRGAGATVVDGNIYTDGTQHVTLDSLIINGTVKARDSQNFTIVNCRLTPAGGGPEDDGIIAWGRSENGYIADNTVLGVTKWEEASLGASGNNSGEGIVVSGPGHVIRNNLVRGFRDGLSLMEDSQAFDQFSIDFLLNDVDQAADDGVEADFCFHNCRVAWNRLTNVFMPLSSQPSLGGPLYFTRNVVYNGLYEAVKLHRSSVGDVAVHNTFVMHGNAFGVYTSEVNSRQWYRNNLFLGGPGKTLNGYDAGPGRVMDLDPFDATSSFNFDAYGTAAATFQGRFRGTSFTGVSQMRNVTTEKSAVEATHAVFNSSVPHPADPFPALAPLDLRIKPGAAVEDKALRLPGLNDGYRGPAPDIGAFEVGDALPCWGPCPKKQNDTQPPTVPANLTATAVSSSQIDLAWSPSSDNVGVAGYRVFRNGTEVATTAMPSHADTGLAANTTYTYNVRAFDAAGNPSALSAPASATTKPSGAGGNNSAPVLATVGDRNVDEGKVLSFKLAASDADGDRIAFSSSGLPQNSTLDAGTGEFKFSPSHSQAGNYAVTFTATDTKGAGDSETVTITVADVNRPPAARVAATELSAKVGERVELDGSLSSDPDGDALSFDWTQVSGPLVGLDGAFEAKASFAPSAAGSYRFDLHVSDGKSDDGPVSATVTVSEPQGRPGPGGGGPWGIEAPIWLGAGVAVAALIAIVAAVLARRGRRSTPAMDSKWGGPGGDEEHPPPR
jgi:chitodextrinase